MKSILDLLPQRERARIINFFGLYLPVRRLDLMFEIPAPHRKGTKPILGIRELEKLYKETSRTPQELLRQTLNQTRALNRYRVSQAEREALTAETLRYVYPLARHQLAHFSSGHMGIPEPESRRDALEALSDNIRALVTSYQLLFKLDYEKSRFAYARARGRIYRSALRILELLKLEQRMRALRFQPLPSGAWRTVNTLFAVIMEYEDVVFHVPSIEHETMPGNTKRRDASVGEVYASIQLFWIMDHFGWPETVQGFIDTYADLVERSVVAGPYQEGGEIPTDCNVTRCWNDAPPGDKVPLSNLGPGILIDYRVFAQSIRLDYRELVRARIEHNQFAIPQTLATLAPAYQLAIGRTMIRGLRQHGSWEDFSRFAAEHRDLRIHCGFDEVRQHMRSVFSQQIREQRKLSNLFAERSAAIGEDHSSTEESLWYVLQDDGNRLRLKTQETQFTYPMGIGTVVAFGFGEREISRPQIGKVTRLFRPAPRTVIIDITKLARYAVPTEIEKVAQPGEEQVPSTPGLLVYDDKLGWGVMTRQQDSLWEQNLVRVKVGKQVLETHLGAVWDLSAEFLLFRLDDAQKRLRTPIYPNPEQTAA